MRTIELQAELCVVGGGMAGVAAAIAAGRRGLKTVLVHDRPVLGGNASSECRVWIQGASSSGGHKYAREGGIVDEIELENLFRNPECNPHLFDALLLEWVTREPNVTLLLDTAALEVQADPIAGGDYARRIRAIAAFNAVNQTRYEISAAMFADTSGDGIVGFLAGADFRMGREGRDEYGESVAPEQADELTLGNSAYFYSKRVDHPVKFVPPSYAIDIRKLNLNENKMNRLHRMAEPFGCELWWVEYGGLLHTIYDAERIKGHLNAITYGIWDYIKNSGQFKDVDNLTLEWVCSLPGRRESRRFLGDLVLTQQHVIEQRDLPDSIGAAGWSIDLHPSAGIYDQGAPSMHVHSDWVYNVPFRCLYSRNVENLLLAGRLISASHVAFGSIRVMGTCAMGGQAIGTAAEICLRRKLTPRQLAGSPEAVDSLRQRLLRDGQHIVGLRNSDPDDLARQSAICASSTAVLDERLDDALGVRLTKGGYVMIPLADPQTEYVELKIAADEPTTLACKLSANDKIVNFNRNVELARREVQLAAGPQWVRIDLPPLAEPQNLWITFEPNAAVELRCGEYTTAGVLLHNFAYPGNRVGAHRHSPCIRLARPQHLYSAGNLIDGHHRPHVFPHAWVSEPLADGPQFVELTLPRPADVDHVQITFNGNVNQHIWTQLIGQDRRTIDELVRDFDVELFNEAGQPIQIADVRDNRQQRVRVDLAARQVRRVRITCRQCWHHDRAEIFEVRLYEPGR